MTGESGPRPGPAVAPVAAPLPAVDTWQATDVAGTLTVTTRTRVRGDEPNLRGHFPGRPVLPGVFVVEAAGQALALAVGAGPVPPPLRAVRSVRFFAPLQDGDELALEVTATPRPAGGWDVTAVGRRLDGTVAARLRAEFGPAAAPPEPAQRPHGEHADVRAVLPQRYPLLLVDRVLELVPGRCIRTVKAVTATEPCYADLPDGAAPHCYDYPRSLLIESLGQSAALLWFDGRLPDPADDRLLMFVGARDYRFEGAARPGDVLRHEVRLDSVVADTAFASGETWVDDRRIATVAGLIATRRPVLPEPAVAATAGSGGHRTAPHTPWEGSP